MIWCERRRAPGAGPQPTDSVLQNTGGNELHEKNKNVYIYV